MAGTKDQENTENSNNAELDSLFSDSIPSLGPRLLEGSIPSLGSYGDTNTSLTQLPEKPQQTSPTLSELLRLLEEDPRQQMNIDKVLVTGKNSQKLSYPDPDETFQSTGPYPLLNNNISSQAGVVMKESTPSKPDPTNSLQQDIKQPQLVPEPEPMQKQLPRVHPSKKTKKLYKGQKSPPPPPRQRYRPILPKGYKPPQQPQVEPEVHQVFAYQPSTKQPSLPQTNRQKPYSLLRPLQAQQFQQKLNQAQLFQERPLQTQPLRTQSFEAQPTRPFQTQPYYQQPHEQPDFLQKPVYDHMGQLLERALTSTVLPPTINGTDIWPEDLALNNFPFTSTVLTAPINGTDSWPEDLTLHDFPFTSTVLPSLTREADTWPEDLALDDPPIPADLLAQQPGPSRITAQTRAKQLASRASRQTEYDAEAHYTPLPYVPQSWGCFRYTRFGELQPGDTFTVAQILHYLTNHPNHTDPSRQLMLWIQRLPADSKLRYPNGKLSHRCRFEACPGEFNLINQGHYRVAFDELTHSHPNHNPMHNAGYVHLFCFERFLDFPELCKFLDIRVETRTLPNEPKGRNGMMFKTSAEVWLAQAFIETCRKDLTPDGYPHCSLPNRPHEGTLTHRLTVKKLEGETTHERAAREKRGGGDSVVSGHLGDLEKEARARSVTRQLVNQNRGGVPAKPKAKLGPKPGSGQSRRKRGGDDDVEDERPRKRRTVKTGKRRQSLSVIEE